MKIVLATHNPGKIKELKSMLNKMGYEVESLLDYPEAPETDETGITFEENALLKATEAASYFGHAVLADDSGIEVDALNGAPGVYSARFSGLDKSHEKNNSLLLEKLKNIPEDKRTAQFVCVLALAKPNGETLTVRGIFKGSIGFESKGSNGFGYDSLFIVPELNKTVAELSDEEKSKISHRSIALEMLKKDLKNFI